MNNETQKVDVLAVLYDAERYANLHGSKTDGGWWSDIIAAREAVAELIEAVKENRVLLQEFANDGKPENYFAWDESERRVMAALARIGGAA